MLFKTVFLCLVACVLGVPAPTNVVPLEKQQPTVIPIVSQSEELDPNGTYKFSYETANGIKREEISYDKGVPKSQQGRSADSNEGGESDESDEIHVQQGSYSYTAPDGTVISVRYIADENGFQPIGDHIPRIGGPSPVAASPNRGSKALKPKDNAGSASAPVAAAKSDTVPDLQSRSAVSPDDVKSTEGASVSTSAAPESEVTTKSADIPEASASTSESSTTEASKVTEGSSEASTTEVPSSVAADSSETSSTGSTTEGSSASEASTESSTTTVSKQLEEGTTAEEAKTTEGSVNTSTTEASSTEAPKETEGTESASTVTPAVSSTAESSTTEVSPTTTVAAA